MTLQAWTTAGWLREHDTQPGEIQHLGSVAAADLAEAAQPQSTPALRFEYAYNAALKACIIALYAERRRPGQVADVHHKLIRSLPLTLGPAREVAADYLDACRERRDRLGREEGDAAIVTSDDAGALLAFARSLHDDVRAWLRERHPELAVE